MPRSTHTINFLLIAQGSKRTLSLRFFGSFFIPSPEIVRSHNSDLWAIWTPNSDSLIFELSDSQTLIPDFVSDLFGLSFLQALWFPILRFLIFRFPEFWILAMLPRITSGVITSGFYIREILCVRLLLHLSPKFRMHNHGWIMPYYLPIHRQPFDLYLLSIPFEMDVLGARLLYLLGFLYVFFLCLACCGLYVLHVSIMAHSCKYVFFLFGLLLLAGIDFVWCAGFCFFC